MKRCRCFKWFLNTYFFVFFFYTPLVNFNRIGYTLEGTDAINSSGYYLKENTL